MADSRPGPPRLDSWKAIAEYLRRDVGTVRRWEKHLGLPVRRVPGGRGRSVFAYTSEIDSWLKAAPSVEPVVAPVAASLRAWRHWLAGTATIVAAVGLVVALRPGDATGSDLRVEARPEGVVAFDTHGTERWRYPFPTGYNTTLAESGNPTRVVTGEHPAVYVATGVSIRRSDGVKESGALTSLDINGRFQRSFSFADEVTRDGQKYGPAWAITSFAVDDRGSARRIAVAAHHHVWDPSLVTVLDDGGRRLGTFVHAGWIESVRWLGPNQLLIGGFSNPHDGGMVALLDAKALNGQGPEPQGTTYHCEGCGKDVPLRMIVMPRSEVNRATVSPFNRANVDVVSDRIFVSTIEVGSSAPYPGDAVYEFTPSLDLINASFSDRYWEIHRALEAQGKLDHTRERCPDRDGPRQIQMWEPATGWRNVQIR